LLVKLRETTRWVTAMYRDQCFYFLKVHFRRY
jgi:hypothetical protein